MQNYFDITIDKTELKTMSALALAHMVRSSAGRI